MNKKEIKKIFHEHNVQINEEAVGLVLDHLRREVTTMAERCTQGNYKRLNAESFWVAIGDWGFESGPRKLSK